MARDIGWSNMQAVATDLLVTYRERNRIFGAALFNAPAWEILLILTLADNGATVEQLATAMAQPEQATRRWLAVLEAEGLVMQALASGDQCHRLTDDGRHGLEEILASAGPPSSTGDQSQAAPGSRPYWRYCR